jgi:hypothetical protein
MMGPASILCVGFAAWLLGVLLLEALSRSRLARYTIDDSIETITRIQQATFTLLTLPPEQRPGARRAIAKDILLDIGFLQSLITEDYRHDPPKNPEIREQSLAVFDEIVKLSWQIRKSLFVFRFRPKLVTDCRLIFDALEGHYRVWISYLHLLKAKYPETYGGISLPDSL